MSGTPSRRLVLAGGVCTLAGAALGAGDTRGNADAPSAVRWARPAIPRRDVSGLWLEDETGAPVPLARFAGEVLVINLWASWCAPCRREMPSLARLASEVAGQGVRVLPLAFERKGPAAVRRFYGETGIDTLPVLLGDAVNLKATLGISRLPTTLVLDGTAHHIATVGGEATWDDAETLAWLMGLAGS